MSISTHQIIPSSYMRTPPHQINYFMVSGGGGGGSGENLYTGSYYYGAGGGGSGGQYQTGYVGFGNFVGSVITITVGAGGAVNGDGNYSMINSNVMSTKTIDGGYKGAKGYVLTAGSWGSGGAANIGGVIAAGSAFAPLYAGGTADYENGTYNEGGVSGGGGGCGSAGGNGNHAGGGISSGGSGGTGIEIIIDGYNTGSYIGCGGGGAVSMKAGGSGSGIPGIGGNNNGGNGAVGRYGDFTACTNAVVNTGSGGGGGAEYTAGSYYGTPGSSGIVILYYPKRFSLPIGTTGSPTYSLINENHVYTFTGSGSITY